MRGVTTSATFTSEFGVSWNTALEAGGITLGDDVTITIDAQLALQP